MQPVAFIWLTISHLLAGSSTVWLQPEENVCGQTHAEQRISGNDSRKMAKLQEHTWTRGGGYFTLKVYLCCCHVTHTDRDRDWAYDLQVKRPIGRKQRGKWTYTLLTFTQRGSYHLSSALWSMRNEERIHEGFSAPDQPWTSANQFSDIPLIWYLEENIKQPSSLSVSPLFTVFYSMLSSLLLLTAEI